MPVPSANFPYYNTVDQIFHAEWSIAKLARHRTAAPLDPHAVARRPPHTADPRGRHGRQGLDLPLSGDGPRLRRQGGGFHEPASLRLPRALQHRRRVCQPGRHHSQPGKQRVRPIASTLPCANPAHVHTFHEVSILHRADALRAARCGVGGHGDRRRRALRPDACARCRGVGADQRRQRPRPHAGRRAVAACARQGRHRAAGRALLYQRHRSRKRWKSCTRCAQRRARRWWRSTMPPWPAW